MIQENAVASANEDLADFVSGSVPGEEVLIRRMLYDVIEKENYYKYIVPENVIFFGKMLDNQGTLLLINEILGKSIEAI